MARIPYETCGQTFGSNFALQRHNQAVHLGHRNFTCQNCGEAFSQRTQLQNHIRRHHENVQIQCQICQETFANVQNQDRHVQSVHNGQTKFKCVSCDKNFRHLSDLKR